MQLAACGSHTEPDKTLCVQQCMASRVNAGVHFQDAVDVTPVCSKIGDAAYEYVSRLIAGTEPVRPPSKGRPVSDIGWLYDKKPDEMADTGEPFMPRAAGIEDAVAPAADAPAADAPAPDGADAPASDTAF